MSRNDCVIIPGIGAILARYVSARFDADNGVVHPPHREFSFNSGLVYNDGILAHSYVRVMDAPYDMALAKVNEAVSKLDTMLRTTGSVQLGRIGSLTFADGALDFHPAADSFALSRMPKLSKPEPKMPAAFDAEELAKEASMRLRLRHTLRQAVRVAASLALLIGICFIASTPIKVDDAALASLSPEFKQATIEDIMAVDAVKEQDATYSINVTGTAGDYLTVDAPMRPVKANAAAKKYYLIVGSFNTASEANKFMAMHSGKNLGRIDSPSHIRVFAGAYDTADEALKALNSTEFRTTGAWICHQ